MEKTKRSVGFAVLIGLSGCNAIAGIREPILDEAGLGGGGAGGAGSSSDAPSSSGGPTLATCKSYCAANTTACTGDNAQWGDRATCEAVCIKAAFPQGKASDTLGDSLECRVSHTSAAKDATTKATHCGHTGLNGGDIDPTTSGGLPCGDVVESFCRLAQAVCTGTYAQWASLDACKTDVAKFAKGAAAFSFVKDATSKLNNINCRTYHLLRAAESNTNAATHCPHIGYASTTCNM